MTPRKRHSLHPRSGELIVLIVIGVLTLVVLTGNFTRILKMLYSPQAALIAVIMLVEYVVLKGADRSVLYKRELDAARAKRREDLLAMREIEAKLIEIQTRLDRLEQNAENAGEIEQTRQELEATLEQLRSRV
jgi:hypothetical protein